MEKDSGIRLLKNLRKVGSAGFIDRSIVESSKTTLILVSFGFF